MSTGWIQRVSQWLLIKKSNRIYSPRNNERHLKSSSSPIRRNRAHIHESTATPAKPPRSPIPLCVRARVTKRLGRLRHATSTTIASIDGSAQHHENGLTHEGVPLLRRESAATRGAYPCGTKWANAWIPESPRNRGLLNIQIRIEMSIDLGSDRCRINIFFLFLSYFILLMFKRQCEGTCGSLSLLQ